MQEEELLKLEKDFEQAIVTNNAEAIGRFLAEHWIIIDSDGDIIDKSRSLELIRSGTLTHKMMKSDDVSVRISGDSAVVTSFTTTKGKYTGQDSKTKEWAMDVYVKQNGRWQCVLTHLTRISKK